MNTCIAYFSKVGNTKIAAEYLAGKMKADIINLDDKTNYKGFIGFMKGGMFASIKKKANLEKSIYEAISKYDRIVLATPVWAGKTTPAINAVLENVDFVGKEVYVMTTQADPAFSGADSRKSFYKTIIEAKHGKLMGYFSLEGSAPGKLPETKEFITNQVDKIVIIP